jgi:hypothetical protein
LFRAGAILLMAMGLLHSLSLLQPPVAKNDTERQLLDLMFNHTFDVIGSRRSMWNFFHGFSIAFTLSYLLSAVSMWRCGANQMECTRKPR